jgi:hypothetical protein
VRHGWRVLRRNVLRKRSEAQWVMERENIGGYGQRHLEKRLEKVLERAHVRCRGGELRPEYGSGEVDIRLVVCVLGLVVVVLQCAVMGIVPLLDGRLVEGGLLQGGVGATQPSERRNGLGEDHDQRQDMRGHGTDRSGIEEALMERPS